MNQPLARIVSDGIGANTTIHVGDTLIPGTHITWQTDARGVATATVTIPNVAIDAQAQLVVGTLPAANVDFGEQVLEVTSELADIRRIGPLGPDDVLVLETAEPWSEERTLRAHERFAHVFPDHKMIVIDAGSTLKVLQVEAGCE